MVNCKDDDDSKSESAQNKITYNGEEFPIIDFEALDDGYDVTLTGIVNQENNGFIIRFISKGMEDVSGNYTINEDEVFNSDLHCPVLMSLPGSDMLISAGDVSVNIEGNMITLEFDLEGIGATGPIKGYYKGSF